MSIQYDAFISYNSRDNLIAEKLAKFLKEKYAIRVFFDRWELTPGETWQETINDALNNSRAVILLIGDQGSSKWADGKFKTLLKKQKKR